MRYCILLILFSLFFIVFCKKNNIDNNEPIDEDRDFDLVIQFERYEQDELEDKPNSGYGSYYWFSRDSIFDEYLSSLVGTLMIPGC